MSYPVPEQPVMPMQQGQATPAPAHDPVYPAGDPVITPEPNGDGPAVDADGRTDFTNRKPRPAFRIGSEVYFGKIEVATGVMMRYSARAMQMQKARAGGEADPQEEIEETVKMFRLLLQKDSADRLIHHLHMIPPTATDEEAERIADEADADPDVVGMETFMDLLPWLMEQYGMAPTEPSSKSVDGSSTSPDDGSESTPNSQNAESTSSTSP